MDMEPNLIGSHTTKTLPRWSDIRKPTIQETYQYLVKLVEGKSPQEFENLDEVLSTGTPLPIFDESLRLIVIDLLRLEKEVVKIFLSQNDNQIKRVLWCEWFFSSLSSDFCIKQLFPFVSVSVRCKIITQLSKYLESAEEAEKYFSYIRKNYGGGRAYFMLPKCSHQFILNHFEKYKLRFDCNSGLRSLMRICQRYPETGFHILSTIFESKKKQPYDLNKYKRVLLYLGGHYPDLMADFLRKHHSYTPSKTFGKKLSKKLSLRLKDSLIPDFLKGNVIMNDKIMFLIFSPEKQVEFLASLVRSSDEVLSFELWKKTDTTLVKFLSLLSPKDRLGMLQSAFKKAYNENFDDHSICWTYSLLENLPTESRLPYVRKLEKLFDAETLEFEKNVDKSFSNSVDQRETFFQLYDSSTGFEKFHELLKKSPSVSTRERILTSAVKNCKINKDTQGLQKLVEFVATRHRNDEDQVLYNFINAVRNEFRPETLNLKIYETLEDLIYFLKVKGLVNNHVHFMWIESHIYHRLENKLDADALVTKLFELAVLESRHAYVLEYRSKHTRTLIMALWEKAHAWILDATSEDSRKKADNLVLNMTETCRAYNYWNKQKRIFFSEVPGLPALLKKKLAERFPDIGGEDWPVEIWDRYYRDVLSLFNSHECLSFVIRRNPFLFVKHFENVLKFAFSIQHKMLTLFFAAFMRTISFFKKTEKVMEILLNEFRNGDSVPKRKVALRLYSQVCTIEEFCQAVEDFVPKKTKVERSDPGFDEIQMWIPSLIKNVRPRWKNFDLILKFYFGDFLKNAGFSFRACCYHTRLDVVLPFLEERLKTIPQKISYQKDIVKLLVELSSLEERSRFLREFWDEFDDNAVRFFLLKSASSAFLDQPSEETFGVLEKFLLDSDDKLISSKPPLHLIPREFFSDYVSALWRFSEKTKPLFRKNFQMSILYSITPDNIDSLKPTLCESIIKEHLFNPSSKLDLYHFTINYILSDPNATPERARLVLTVLKERESPSDLFQKFLQTLTENVSRNSVLFDIILQNWPKCPEGMFFEERELLSLHRLYHALPDATPAELGKELAETFSKMDGLNELLVIFTKIFTNFLSSLGPLKAVLTIKELVANAPNRTIAALAICSVPAKAVEWYGAKGQEGSGIAETKKTLNEIVTILNSRGDKVLDVYRWWKLGFVKP